MTAGDNSLASTAATVRAASKLEVADTLLDMHDGAELLPELISVEHFAQSNRLECCMHSRIAAFDPMRNQPYRWFESSERSQV